MTFLVYVQKLAEPLGVLTKMKRRSGRGSGINVYSGTTLLSMYVNVYVCCRSLSVLFIDMLQYYFWGSNIGAVCSF